MDDNGSGRLARLLDRFGPFLGLVVVAGLFAAVAPSGFASAYNAKTILTQSVIVGVCALGMTFVIRSGGIDLSVGSAIAFGEEMGFMKSLGCSVAIGGTFLYAIADDIPKMLGLAKDKKA